MVAPLSIVVKDSGEDGPGILAEGAIPAILLVSSEPRGEAKKN